MPQIVRRPDQRHHRAQHEIKAREAEGGQRARPDRQRQHLEDDLAAGHVDQRAAAEIGDEGADVKNGNQ